MLFDAGKNDLEMRDDRSLAITVDSSADLSLSQIGEGRAVVRRSVGCLYTGGNAKRWRYWLSAIDPRSNSEAKREGG